MNEVAPERGVNEAAFGFGLNAGASGLIFVLAGAALGLNSPANGFSFVDFFGCSTAFSGGTSSEAMPPDPHPCGSFYRR